MNLYAVCVLIMCIAVTSAASTSTSAMFPARYHADVGIPEAARILAEERDALSSRIVGGLPSYNGEHPFFGGLLISLNSGATSVCGSSLVSSTRLVTAAHCWYDGFDTAYAILVVLGSTKLFSGGTRVYASSIAAHALYSPGSPSYDIAVLKVPTVSFSSYVQPIQLPPGSDSYERYTAEAIGYGRTSDSASITTAASLRDVFVPVISNSECAAVYGGAITPAIICTSGAGGRGPCGGDSGGPLILYNYRINDTLIGVINFLSTLGCSAGSPAGYVRVSYHAAWIRAQL